MLRQQVAVLLAITSSILVLRVHAYIPAYPTNDTSILRNETDFIQINWLPMGVSAYKDALSRQLVYGQQDNGDLAGYRVSWPVSRRCLGLNPNHYLHP